jgi:hypothetical protein
VCVCVCVCVCVRTQFLSQRTLQIKMSPPSSVSKNKQRTMQPCSGVACAGPALGSSFVPEVGAVLFALTIRRCPRQDRTVPEHCLFQRVSRRALGTSQWEPGTLSRGEATQGNVGPECDRLVRHLGVSRHGCHSSHLGSSSSRTDPPEAAQHLQASVGAVHGTNLHARLSPHYRPSHLKSPSTGAIVCHL